MGVISVEHSSNLFWLGRYAERVYITLVAFFEYYDAMLDKDKDSYKELLEKLRVRDNFGNGENFIQGFLYDDGGFSCDASINTAFTCAYDNALVTRDVIGSESLAYMQLALDAFHFSRDARNLRLALMPAVDYLLAFWGSMEGNLASGEAGTIVKCGKFIERLDLYFRLGVDHKLIEREYDNLCHVLAHVRKNTPFSYNTQQLSVLVEVVAMKERYAERTEDALSCLGRLFEPQGQRLAG